MSESLRSNETRLRREDWYVRPVPAAEARPFIVEHHYARGTSTTAVYVFGLFPRAWDLLAGVTWWLPPTRVAAESVAGPEWRRVLALSRMAVHPAAPKNACTFLLARSVRAIRQEKRFTALVTYADESQGHTGGVYRAAGWAYAGRRPGSPRWVDPATGRQVATQATRTRTRAQMEALGYQRSGPFAKHKFILRLES